jgi:hypothetical protein
MANEGACNASGCAEAERVASWRKAMLSAGGAAPFCNQASAYGAGFREGMKFARASPMSAWIRCDERMPDMYETVLAYVPEANGPTVRAVYRRADEGFHEKLDAGESGRDLHWHENEVTHWMPFPAAPGDDAEASR